jgi:hypothetical protein
VLDEAHAFWLCRPGRGEIRPVALPEPGRDDVVVRTLRSGVSRGTETLVFRGGVPPSQYVAMRAPFQEGDFPGPVKYGYLNVGAVEQGPQELRGRTVFLTTHDMGTATAVCDRVAFVVDGRIVLCESPRALRLAYGRRELQVEYRTETGLARAAFPLDGASPELQRLLASGRVETVHTTEANLDDVFVQVTGQAL